MTPEEMHREFDILYNSIASNIAPSVSEYEVSVFLTQAQEQLVISVYNGTYPTGISFETTEEARSYLRELNMTQDTELFVRNDDGNYEVIPANDLWFIIMEEGMASNDDCYAGQWIAANPVSHNEYQRVIKNPFRGPNNRRILRMDENGKCNIIAKIDLSRYRIHYLRRPNPIIVDDLPLSVNGETRKRGCELNDVFHRTIVIQAVSLARQALTMGTIQPS